ncbi:MAG: hypothetical protein JXR83_09660 [Deltaproteobacteria bacterium]|nr:hypothetical protein [Deltaproteobacteria bacterium]
MFKLAPELRSVAAPVDRIVSVIEGLNTPNVVIPGYDSEPTRCCVVGVRNPEGTFDILIHLFQPESQHLAIYASEPRAVPLAHFAMIEAEAVQFVESMGFMVDNLNFRKLPPEKQAEIMARLPVFHEVRRTPPGQVVGMADLEDLGDEGGALHELEELEPLEPVRTDDVNLPLATVESSGMLALSKADLEEVADAFASGFDAARAPSAREPAGPELTREQRRALLRLVSAF